MFYVYCIECLEPNHFYVGQTENFEHRKISHQNGTGARFVRKHVFKNIHLITTAPTRDIAKQIESLLYKVLRRKGVVVGGFGRPNTVPIWTQKWRERHGMNN